MLLRINLLLTLIVNSPMRAMLDMFSTLLNAFANAEVTTARTLKSSTPLLVHADLKSHSFHPCKVLHAPGASVVKPMRTFQQLTGVITVQPRCRTGICAIQKTLDLPRLIQS